MTNNKKVELKTNNTQGTGLKVLKSALLAFTLMPLAAIASDTQVEVPTAASGYRESVRCMPEVHTAGSLRHIYGEPAEMSLKAQEKGIKLVPLHASIDGDYEPDVLLFGADTYRESVACTARHWDTLISHNVSVQWMPDASLEEQEELPTEMLPDEGQVNAASE